MDMSRKFLAALLAHREVAPLLGRALFGRRHADQGLGINEELPAQAIRRAAR